MLESAGDVGMGGFPEWFGWRRVRCLVEVDSGGGFIAWGGGLQRKRGRRLQLALSGLGLC